MIEALIDLANELRDGLQHVDQLTPEQRGMLISDVKTLIHDMEGCLQ
jgi:hypothetical protein